MMQPTETMTTITSQEILEEERPVVHIEAPILRQYSVSVVRPMPPDNTCSPLHDICWTCLRSLPEPAIYRKINTRPRELELVPQGEPCSFCEEMTRNAY